MTSLVNYSGSTVIGNSLFGSVNTVTSPGTSTLVAASAGCLQVVGTDATYIVDLPDATTLAATGHTVEIRNDTTVTVVSIKNAAGTVLFVLRPKIRLFATCMDTSSSAGQWSFDAGSAYPRRLCTNGLPGTLVGTAKYSAGATMTTMDLYGGPISCFGTFTLTMPSAADFHSNLSTILGTAPPPGFNFQTAIWAASGTQSYAANTGVTWRGPTTGAGALYSGQLWVQYETPSAYWILNMRDY
jgi:hypothetical protein